MTEEKTSSGREDGRRFATFTLASVTAVPPNDAPVANPADAILVSARREIERNGIVGLRVADVATGANVSLTQIYRYFGDRDGLLARVLGDIYEELVVGSTSQLHAAVERATTLTVDTFLDFFPPYSQIATSINQELRLQILALAVNNEPLRERLGMITSVNVARLKSILDLAEQKIPSGENFDRRVFEILLPIQMPYYWTLMGEQAFGDAEFRSFLGDITRNRRD